MKKLFLLLVSAALVVSPAWADTVHKKKMTKEQAEAAELDQHLVRADRNRGVDAHHRGAQVVRHAREEIDHVPAAARHAGPASDGMTYSPFICDNVAASIMESN